MNAQGGNLKTWWSAQELADAKLPRLPGTKRKINELAKDRGWPLATDAQGAPLARPRAGRGGGLEYHKALLPPAAMAELIKRGLSTPAEVEPATETPRDQLWSWFDRQSDDVKAVARGRLEAVQAIEALEQARHTRSAAVALTAAAKDVSPATLWNWLSHIKGVAPADYLPRLAPRRQGGGAVAEIDADLWQAFKSDYLRPERPTAAASYQLTKQIADKTGRTLPHLKTFQRKLEREVDPRVVVLKRSGTEALRRTIPPQKRSVLDLAALELVNIDGHRWDVFVRFPAANGEPERIARPMMVAIQDVYSRKFLSWRIGATESAVQTRLVFADLITKWGVPRACLLDNGRAFASKWITGGAANRFRFKIREEDPQGLLVALGVELHWAKPYRGQSKPIERGFRDFCDGIAKHPAFAGAYVGNRPDAKPENYGERAVDLAVFERIVSKAIAAHNAKPGRRTETAQGRSFDDAFAESYATTQPRIAGPEQRRLALLAADQVRADRKTGAVSLYGNSYCNDALYAVAGQKVTVRFDPDDLSLPVAVYGPDGAFLTEAEPVGLTGFLDVQAAKARGRQEAELRKAVRRQAELEDLLSAAELAALLPDDEPENPIEQPTVVRPARMRGGAAAAAAPMRRNLLDSLDAESLAPVRTARPELRVVE